MKSLGTLRLRESGRDK